MAIGGRQIVNYNPPTSSSNQSSTGIQQATTTSNQQAQQAADASQFSQSYIPEYSQTPIMESIAKQAQQMAPEVYAWGMNQYNKNQGNIDAMMRNAMTYASPQRIAAEMGKAQAGVQQGAEAGRQSAIQDLQSYGIDPSSGRYAALDQASRVMSGAAAAGAGNQAREATTATGSAMQGAAQQASAQNYQTGYGAAQAASGLLGVASQLKYAPLGTMSGGTSTSSGSSSGGTTSLSRSINTSTGSSGNTGGGYARGAKGGGVSANPSMIGAEQPDGDPTTGGFVSHELSPSNGSQVDDVQARLNAGEFVIPKDVTAWKGQEFFYKLMAQARKMRAMAGSENGDNSSMMDGEAAEGDQATGYGGGGNQQLLPPPSSYQTGYGQQ